MSYNSDRNDVLYVEQRRKRICDLIRSDGVVTVSGLRDLFGVSATTIRIDLSELESRGVLERTHGGAVTPQGIGRELTTSEKTALDIPAKRAIAAEAVRLIRPGMSVALDTGTTCYELAKLISGIPDVTVVTSDIQCAAFLEQAGTRQVILLGGTIRSGFHCTTGTTVLRQLEGMYFDIFFLATNGIDFTRGLSTPNADIAAIKRRMIDISRKTILLADKSKFGKNAFSRFAELADISGIITDAERPEELTQVPEFRHIRFTHVENARTEA